jgi:hypothetical protein
MQCFKNPLKDLHNFKMWISFSEKRIDVNK